MKKIFSIIMILTLTAGVSYARGYDFNFPLPGESIANDSLQYNVVKEIYSDAAQKYPACLDYNVINTQIVHYPYDVKEKKGKFVSGYWKEIWSVKACDSVIQVPLTFYIKKKKTIYSYDKTLFNESLF